MSTEDCSAKEPEIIISTEYVDATGFTKAPGGGLAVSTQRGSYQPTADAQQVLANLLHMAETYLVLNLQLPTGIVLPAFGRLSDYQLTRTNGRDVLYLSRDQLRVLGASLVDRAIEECA